MIQGVLNLPMPWVDRPFRLDPASGRLFRFDAEWRFYLGIYWQQPDGEFEDRRTPVSFRFLEASKPAEGIS